MSTGPPGRVRVYVPPPHKILQLQTIAIVIPFRYTVTMTDLVRTAVSSFSNNVEVIDVAPPEEYEFVLHAQSLGNITNKDIARWLSSHTSLELEPTEIARIRGTKMYQNLLQAATATAEDGVALARATAQTKAWKTLGTVVEEMEARVATGEVDEKDLADIAKTVLGQLKGPERSLTIRAVDRR